MLSQLPALHSDAQKGPPLVSTGSDLKAQPDPVKIPAALSYGNPRKDQEQRSWLNELASSSMLSILVTEAIFQAEISTLKFLAPVNWHREAKNRIMVGKMGTKERQHAREA